MWCHYRLNGIFRFDSVIDITCRQTQDISKDEVFKVELAVVLTICSFPELLFPHSLPHGTVTQAAHELFPDLVHLAHSCVPHDEQLACRSDEVESLVLGVKHVDEGEPEVFVRRCELKLFSVIPCVRAGANLLDRLDGYFAV